MLKRGIFICLFMFLMVGCGFTSEAKTLMEPKDEFIIVIDPGHGGDNWGTTSNENFKEKEITMKTARALVDELSKYDGVKVLMTREKDVDLSLKQRAVYAAKVEADFMFSIHYNASEAHTMFGTEVWIPLNAPYHALGYQFAYIQQLEMQDLGLFSRGIKTRINDEGTDYYGIIRESVARNVPAVIIEHCYVDEERDIPYCDEDTDYEALGKRDAKAIAAFLGLEPYELPESVEALAITDVVADTHIDLSEPNLCHLVAEYYDKENQLLTITVSGCDDDTSLMYYDYTLDGGQSFSKIYPWPGSDLLTGEYDEEFSLMLPLDEKQNAQIYVRAYNKFDIYQESNVLNNFSNVPLKEEVVTEIPTVQDTRPPEAESVDETTNEANNTELKEYEPVSFDEAQAELEKENSRLVVLCVFVIFWLLLLAVFGLIVYRLFLKRKNEARNSKE